MDVFLKIAVLSCFMFSCICNEVDITSEPVDQIIENADANLQPAGLSDNNETLVNTTSTVTGITGNLTQNDTDVSNVSQKLVQCIPQNGTAEVHLVNDTELIKAFLPEVNVTSRDVPANCLLVLFYSRHCPFSSMAAPHFNALPRAFPHIEMLALDAMTYHTFNAHNGIVGVPTLLLFHNGRLVAKFNESEYTLELFSKFLTKHTGIVAADKSYVTSADFSGPVISVPAKDFDAFLIISWLFIIICAVYYFTKSRFWKWIVETVQSNWRESEVHAAQHEHAE